MIRTRAPDGSAGASGSRTMRQSARASAATKRGVLRGQGAHDPCAVSAPFGDRPEIMLTRPVGLERLAEDRLGQRPRRFGEPEHAAKHRLQEDMRRDQRRDRIAGKAQHALGAHAPVEQGLARPHGDLGEVELKPFGSSARSRRDRARRPRRRRWSRGCRRLCRRGRASPGCRLVLGDAEPHRPRRPRPRSARRAHKGTDETIWSGPSSEPGGTTSSPVARIATLGLRRTGKLGMVHGGGEKRARGRQAACRPRAVPRLRGNPGPRGRMCRPRFGLLR